MISLTFTQSQIDTLSHTRLPLEPLLERDPYFLEKYEILLDELGQPPSFSEKGSKGKNDVERLDSVISSNSFIQVCNLRLEAILLANYYNQHTEFGAYVIHDLQDPEKDEEYGVLVFEQDFPA